MFNLFNLRRPSDFKKEKHNGEERGGDEGCGEFSAANVFYGCLFFLE